jgi:hypothetical protein
VTQKFNNTPLIFHFNIVYYYFLQKKAFPFEQLVWGSFMPGPFVGDTSQSSA